MPAAVQDLAIWALAAAFLGSAAAVWLAGSRLAVNVDRLTRRTGMGHAFMGMVLLGGITSLPEVAAVSTSAAIGNAPLAINNLLGTASINLVLLALADIVYGRGPLTRAAAEPATLLQGVLSMLLATTVALVATAGDIAIFGVGAGSAVLALGSLAALRLASDFEHRHVWEAVEDLADEGGRPGEAEGGDARTIGGLAAALALWGIAILVAGFILASSADVIAARTGIASGMVGFLLVGFATSLPELSSIIAAIRLGRYQMAVGDIFGTNLFNIMLIFLADLIYRGAPVLGEAGRFEAIGATVAALLTGIFVVGLLERRDRAVLRMGYDSLAVLLLFGGAVFLLAQTGGAG